MHDYRTPRVERKPDRLRWWLWHHLSNRPGVCPARAHDVLIWRNRESVRVNWMCHDDYARNGTCWCGKLGGDV